MPITVVRPSIIESALAEPRPGWIRGFRMAEPIIISYARGLLSEFPGVPEGVIDVIPVDMVVAAILAVAAPGPDPDGPAVYHVASGVRNPLRYGRLVELVQDWFVGTPSTTTAVSRSRAPVVLPRPRTRPAPAPAGDPGHGHRREVLTTLPLRGRQAALAARLEDRHALATGPSATSSSTALTPRPRPGTASTGCWPWALPRDADRAEFSFDPAAIDWDHYVRDVHLPSVVGHARVRTAPGRSVVDKRPERARARHPLPRTPPGGVRPRAHAHGFERRRHLRLARQPAPPGGQAGTFVAGLLREAPSLLALDRRDRGDFLRSFYRRYEDAPVDQLAEDAWELFHRCSSPGPSPPASPGCGEHRRARPPDAAGHRRPRLRRGPAATALRRHGLRPHGPGGRPLRRATGGAPPIGEARALMLADYAAAHGLPRRVRRLRRLGQRPGDAGGSGFPGRGQPRVPAGGHRPPARLARRALGEGLGRGRPAAAHRAPRRPVAARRPRVARVRARGRAQRAPVRRCPGRLGPRIGTLGRHRPAAAGGHPAASPSRPDWHHVRPVLSGVCGSDLATVDGRSSRYFEDLVSFPFVPGHEVVGPGPDDRGEPGRRAVRVEPVLGCLARRSTPPCPACAAGRTGNCERVAFGHLRPGLQTGYCADTGGGWSAAGLVAHPTQLYAVPDQLADEER